MEITDVVQNEAEAPQGRKTTRNLPNDLKAMAEVYKIMDELPPADARRVLVYIADKYGDGGDRWTVAAGE